jgi:predicted deacetylase
MKNSEKKKGKALLSIHDVSPFFEEEIFGILSDLKGLNLGKTNLAVVPLYHESYHLNDHVAFCHSLMNAIEGFEVEILLHGLYHTRKGSNQRLSFKNRFRSRLQSAEEDEFFKLVPAEAEKRIQQGRSILEKAFHTKPTGFIPPAWVFEKQVMATLKRLEIPYTENHSFIFLTRDDKRVFSPVISFATRTKTREILSLCWAYFMRKIPSRRAIMRFVIHPKDYRSRVVKRTIIKTLKKLDEKYEWKLYQDLFP